MGKAAGEGTRSITYRFDWTDGRRQEFTVRLSSPDMGLQATPRSRYPDWTRLDFHKCPNCPLKAESTPRCPVAVSLVDLVAQFKDFQSTETADVTIVTEEREYRKTVSLQAGLSSLMGLYMATSGCPLLDKLRPMVYTHLPFSTLRETMYRAISMYLMSQFLLSHEGGEPDWQLKGFKSLCAEINVVNRAFLQRLLSVAPQDASLNALTKLDCLAGFSAFSLDNGYQEKLAELFAPYLKPALGDGP